MSIMICYYQKVVYMYMLPCYQKYWKIDTHVEELEIKFGVQDVYII